MQWSIFSVDLGSTIGSGESERRSVLVVSRESANRSLPVVTVLPIVDRRRGRRVYPNEVLLRSGTAGLERDAIAMAHQTRAVAKARLETLLGTIEDHDLRSAIRHAMRLQLSLEPA